MTNQWTKDPTAVLDYEIDWSQWLESGDTITTSTWSITPTGELAEQSSISAPTSSVVWLTGGTPGGAYRVTNEITTVDGRADARSLTINVSPR